MPGGMFLVLADVEPLTEIVRRTPEPVFVDGHEPRVIALAAGSGGEGFATIGSATGPGTRLGSLGPWYRVVVEVTLHDPSDPSPPLRHRITHPLLEPFLNLFH